MACWGCCTETPCAGQYKQRDIQLHLVPKDGGKIPSSQGLSPWVTNCRLPKIFYVAQNPGISVCLNSILFFVCLFDFVCLLLRQELGMAHAGLRLTVTWFSFLYF